MKNNSHWTQIVILFMLKQNPKQIVSTLFDTDVASSLKDDPYQLLSLEVSDRILKVTVRPASHTDDLSRTAFDKMIRLQGNFIQSEILFIFALIILLTPNLSSLSLFFSPSKINTYKTLKCRVSNNLSDYRLAQSRSKLSDFLENHVGLTSCCCRLRCVQCLCHVCVCYQKNCHRNVS